MHWIWDNIRDLGGNPSSMTLFGENDGATHILLHTMSDMSRGMFQKIIIHNPLIRIESLFQRYTRQRKQKLRAVLDCNKRPDCLYQTSLRRILTEAFALEVELGPWLPVVDHNIVLNYTSEEDLHPVDMMAGFSEFASFSDHQNFPLLGDGQVLEDLNLAISEISQRFDKGKVIFLTLYQMLQ